MSGTPPPPKRIRCCELAQACFCAVAHGTCMCKCSWLDKPASAADRLSSMNTVIIMQIDTWTLRRYYCIIIIWGPMSQPPAELVKGLCSYIMLLRLLQSNVGYITVEVVLYKSYHELADNTAAVLACQKITLHGSQAKGGTADLAPRFANSNCGKSKFLKAQSFKVQTLWKLTINGKKHN